MSAGSEGLRRAQHCSCCRDTALSSPVIPLDGNKGPLFGGNWEENQSLIQGKLILVNGFV